MRRSIIYTVAGNEIEVDYSIGLQAAKLQASRIRTSRTFKVNDQPVLTLKACEIAMVHHDVEEIGTNPTDFFLNKNENLEPQLSAAEMVKMAKDRPVLQSKELMDCLGFEMREPDQFIVPHRFGYVMSIPTLFVEGEIQPIKIKTINQLLTELMKRDYDVQEATLKYLTKE